MARCWTRIFIVSGPRRKKKRRKKEKEGVNYIHVAVVRDGSFGLKSREPI